MKVLVHFTCKCQMICLSCTMFFVMWMWRCKYQSSPLGLLVTFPFFISASLGLGLPPFF